MFCIHEPLYHPSVKSTWMWTNVVFHHKNYFHFFRDSLESIQRVKRSSIFSLAMTDAKIPYGSSYERLPKLNGTKCQYYPWQIIYKYKEVSSSYPSVAYWNLILNNLWKMRCTIILIKFLSNYSFHIKYPSNLPSLV